MVGLSEKATDRWADISVSANRCHFLWAGNVLLKGVEIGRNVGGFPGCGWRTSDAGCVSPVTPMEWLPTTTSQLGVSVQCWVL